MIEVAAAVIIRDGKVLLASRPENKPPPGWEFPGGKLENGESVADAAIRELREELDLEIVPHEIIYELTTEKIKLYFIRCSLLGNQIPIPKEQQQFRWQRITPEIPEGLLKNDLIFWNFLNSVK